MSSVILIVFPFSSKTCVVCGSLVLSVRTFNSVALLVREKSHLTSGYIEAITQVHAVF